MMTKLEIINKVIEIQEDFTAWQGKFLMNLHLGVCHTFSYIKIPREYILLKKTVEKDFETLFNDTDTDTDTVYWLDDDKLGLVQNNLNRLTCLYLFREIIKEENK